MLAYCGASAAHAIAGACIAAATELGGVYQGIGYAAMTYAALAAGDVTAALEASDAARPILRAQPDQVTMHQVLMAQLALAGGDAIAARQFANDAVDATNGWHRMVALTIRARVATARGEPELARDDAHAALACGAELHIYQACQMPWNSSPAWPARSAVTPKVSAFSVPQPPFGNRHVRSASRFGMPATRPR